MAAVNQTMRRPKPSTKNEELGLHWRLLNHALHGGGCSMYPQIYSVHSGSNDIIVTALSRQQIIINNLNNDYNDNVFSKVKMYHCMDKP